MDWNGLKSFLVIAKSGSLSGAANQLGVNHSTMFRRLRAFEKDIGGRLFERINQRYVLTAMGEELLGYSKTMADTVDLIERRIAGKDVQPKGTVRITAPYNIACRYLPTMLAEFRRSYPDIHLDFLSSNQEINMNTRQADIAVRATPAPPEHLIGRPVAEIPWSVFSSPSYQQKYGCPETIAELDRHRLIGATGLLASLPGFTWLERQFREQITSRCDELTAMSYLVESGHGLAFLPNDQARPGIHKVLDFPAATPSKLWLLTHPDLREVERIRLVLAALATAFANMDWQLEATE